MLKSFKTPSTSNHQTLNTPKSYKNTYLETAKNYQSPAKFLKENKTSEPSSIKKPYQRAQQIKNTYSKPPSQNSYDHNSINSRLEQIRKKYQNKLKFQSKQLSDNRSTPLKDSKVANNIYQKYSNSQYKKDYPSNIGNNQQTPTLLKSFSFLNKQHGSQKKQNLKLNQDNSIYKNMSSVNQSETKGLRSSTIGRDYEYKYSNNNSNSSGDYIKSKQNLQYKRMQLTSTNTSWTVQNKQEQRKGIDKQSYQQYFKNRSRPKTQYEKTPTKNNTNPPVIKQDQRIQSINKINYKIKEILNFINENQNDKQSNLGVSNVTQSKNNQTLTQSKISILNQSKIYKSKNYDAKQSRFQIPETSKDKDKKLITPFIKKNIQPQKINSDQYKPFQKRQRAESTNLTRNLQKYRQQNSYTPSRQYKQPNSDLDEQIKKIQDKIQKSQIQKKKLNVKFQEIRTKKINDTKDDVQIKNNNSNIQFRSNQNIQSNYPKSSIKKNISRPIQQKYQQYIPKIVQPKSMKTPYSQQRQSFNRYPQRILDKNVEKPLNVSSTKTPQRKTDKLIEECQDRSNDKPFSRYIQKNSNQTVDRLVDKYTDKNNQKSNNREYQEIKPAKMQFRIIPIPCQMDSQFKEQTKKLIKSIQDQVCLDEQFRNAKIWFQGWGNSEKWQQLKKEISKVNLQLNDNEIKIQFQNTLQEHNPFYGGKDQSQTVQSYVNKYMECNNHWKNNILHKFNGNELCNENFKEELIDLQRKGYLTVQDFVRFLNIQTGTFYRNRDLILIFRRLTKNNKIRFEQWMELIVERE